MNKDMVTPRAGVGAGIGALIGFLFGGPVGAGIGALVGGGVAHASGDPGKGVMTPKRKLIYTRAMESIKDPEELKKLADAFAAEGLVGEASLLRKRAALRELPDTTKDKRRAYFRKAMASDKPEVILEVATAFEKEGAIDAGKTLRDHAEAVKAAHAAGKSARPLTGGSQQAFADKLAKAIIHFGPGSAQAREAAGNLLQARGKKATDALITEVIRIAADALKIDAPEADGPPAQPINIDATANAQASDPGGLEPTTVGPPTGAVDKQVIADGAAPPAAREAPPTDPAPAMPEGDEEADEAVEASAVLAAEDKRLRDEQSPEPEAGV